MGQQFANLNKIKMLLIPRTKFNLAIMKRVGNFKVLLNPALALHHHKRVIALKVVYQSKPDKPDASLSVGIQASVTDMLIISRLGIYYH